MKSQSERRLTYGLNVVIASIVAVLLVIFVNWIADRRLRSNLPVEVRRWIRYDLTATRSYSLSKQTLNVLKDLEDDYRVVTMFDTEGPNIDMAKDLIDEYEAYSNHVTVQHISPLRDIAARKAFLASLLERHEAELEPMKAAIARGKDALERVRGDVTQQLEPLRSVLEDPALAEGQLKQFIQSVAQVFTRFDSQLDDANREIDAAMDSALPAYNSARTAVQNILTDLDERVFAIAIEQFKRAADDEATPASVRNGLLALVDQFEASRQTLQETLAALRGVEAVQAYDQLRSQIMADPNTVTIVGPKQVQVLKLADLFRTPTAEQVAAENQRAEPVFLGEERITGSLASMSLDHKPMVVFVSSGPDPLGRGDAQMTYNQVAQRLRNMNFEVESWSPMPQPNPMTGQTMPPGPRPEPEPGQKAVWIFLPGQPSNPMNPMAAAGPQEVAALAQERMDAGDGVMMLLMAQPMASFGPGDPMAPMLEEWGVTAQLDRIVMRQQVLPDRRKQALPQHDVTRWPDAVAITQALGASRGIFLQPSPLIFTEAGDRKVYPLVELTGDKLWAETNLMQIRDAAPDESTASDKFVVGAAVEDSDKRLIVVADPIWAADYITGYGMLGEGTASMFGSMFPGNSELFVNSVYWLAGMDQLIAAGARTQDIRRIGNISPGAYSTIWWSLILGMPLATGVCGVGVWMMRRG